MKWMRIQNPARPDKSDAMHNFLMSRPIRKRFVCLRRRNKAVTCIPNTQTLEQNKLDPRKRNKIEKTACIHSTKIFKISKSYQIRSGPAIWTKRQEKKVEEKTPLPDGEDL